MKLAAVVLMIAFGCLAGFAQNASVEQNFEKNKLKYKLEKFAEGEDASSGYDYLIYKKGDEIVKIREIWSSSANPNYRVEDYFFKDGKLVVLAKYALAKKNYKASVRGANIPLKELEKFYLTDSKLTVWKENGKTVPTGDSRWQEKEKEILERASGQLETYQQLKESND